MIIVRMQVCVCVCVSLSLSIGQVLTGRSSAQPPPAFSASSRRRTGWTGQKSISYRRLRFVGRRLDHTHAINCWRRIGFGSFGGAERRAACRSAQPVALKQIGRRRRRRPTRRELAGVICLTKSLNKLAWFVCGPAGRVAAAARRAAPLTRRASTAFRLRK